MRRENYRDESTIRDRIRFDGSIATYNDEKVSIRIVKVTPTEEGAEFCAEIKDSEGRKTYSGTLERNHYGELSDLESKRLCISAIEKILTSPSNT